MSSKLILEVSSPDKHYPEKIYPKTVLNDLKRLIQLILADGSHFVICLKMLSADRCPVNIFLKLVVLTNIIHQ